MNKEILKAKELSLPIMYSEGSCDEALIKRLDSYFEFLFRTKKCSLITREEINKFKIDIKKMFVEYYLGHQYKAYSVFKDALQDLTHGMDLVTTILPKESLYRARINEDNQDYRNDEMFHIKYCHRSKVQTQRFSFPGLPCLYLGGSSYVCWLELNRPSFDKFQVAYIRQRDNKKEYKVIDLSIHPLHLYNELIAIEKNSSSGSQTLPTVEKYLKWWPIIACCSVAVKNEDDPFKPEYIFPQFMLQYLLEEQEDLIGIRYLSIKAGRISMKQYETDYRTCINFVIPTRSVEPDDEGFCTKLNEQFKIGKNISGKELQVASDMIRENGIAWGSFDSDASSLDSAKIYGTNDTEYLYKDSIFRRIENILDTEDSILNNMISKR